MFRELQETLVIEALSTRHETEDGEAGLAGGSHIPGASHPKRK